jgi:NAD(P)-dependent dehydrogenase (short-subunit alcohol dehydrogenase family)
MAQGVLTGKVAIVTGAASPKGMGRAITLAFIQAGARVAMLDIKRAWLDERLEEMRRIGGPNCALAILADVGNPPAIDVAVQRTISELGGLHILVNNAGTTPLHLGLVEASESNFWEVPPEAWKGVMAVNCDGPFFAARAVASHMIRQRWGRIIGVTTSLDTMYRKQGSPYGPSKAGHEALVATMAQELEGTGVTANVLVPGGVTNTNLLPADVPFDREKIIQPEVMQAPAVWLASEASHGINGRRLIAYYWDERLPLAERLAKAAAPAAWSQLGAQAVAPMLKRPT